MYRKNACVGKRFFDVVECCFCDFFGVSQCRLQCVGYAMLFVALFCFFVFAQAFKEATEAAFFAVEHIHHACKSAVGYEPHRPRCDCAVGHILDGVGEHFGVFG